jgi:NDP-sugar pyrophosphorylase family protein
MVIVNGKPLLQWIVAWLRSHGVSRLVIGVSYQSDAISRHFRDGSGTGMDILYSEHTIEGGTSEGFRLAISRHVDDNSFFAMNGDQITDLDLSRFLSYHVSNGAMATLAITRPRIPFGEVKIDRARNVVRFEEKPVAPTFCSMGIYVWNRSILKVIPRRGDVETGVYPWLASAGHLKAYIHPGYFLTINTPKDLTDAEKELASQS